ncbi:unnamed protein product, partial [Ectocarpus fasciculatus]
MECEASIEETRGEPARALAMFERALALAEAHGEALMAAKLHSHIGVHHKSRGDLDAAAAAQREALRRYEQLQAAPLSIANVLGRLGSISTLLGHGEAARSYFQRALAMLEALPDGAGFYAG